MGQGMRKDLLKRLCEAHEAGSCLFAQSPSEAHRLRDAYRRGDLISPAPRVYALPELWTQLKPIEQERHRLRALGQLHPDWVFASFSAAAAYGLEVSYRLYGKVHLACCPQMTHGRNVVDILADERLRESRLTGANAKVMRFSYADVLDAQKFCHLMSSFGIPNGFAVPRVAMS